MSRRDDQRNFLQSEIRELDRLLSVLPDSAVLDRQNLEYRRAAVQTELERAPVPVQLPAQMRVLFSGQPVIGSEGIFVDFAMEALRRIDIAVRAVAASRFTTLADRGPIPTIGQRRLMVSRTVPGSFGFEIAEEPRRGQRPRNRESGMGEAMSRSLDVLAASLADDTEALANELVGLDHRAVASIRRVLELLENRGAMCTFEHGDQTVVFDDAALVAKGANALGANNIEEGSMTLLGHFVGYLPDSSVAEFEEAEEQSVTRLRVADEIAEGMDINRILNVPVVVVVNYRRVRNTQPQYLVVMVQVVPATE